MELNSILDGFYGKDSFENYSNTRQIDFSIVDPNGFLVFEFKNFDNKTGRPRVYPFEVSSQNAVDYKYVNRVLQYLIVESDIMIKGRKESDREKPGKKYTLYLQGQVIDFIEQREFKMKGRIMHESEDKVYLNTKTKSFEIVMYEPHNAKKVQAYRVGYLRDQQTRGETYVSMLDSAIPYLLKGIDINSELDLAIKFHANPKLIEIGSPCEEDGCYKGLSSVTNKACEVCKGTGRIKNRHASQDVIIVDPPKSKEEFIPLREYSHQNQAPIDILEFMKTTLIILQSMLKELCIIVINLLLTEG